MRYLKPPEAAVMNPVGAAKRKTVEINGILVHILAMLKTSTKMYPGYLHPELSPRFEVIVTEFGP